MRFVLFRAPPDNDDEPIGQPEPDGEWRDYYRMRERAERAAAKRAESISARRVHQELAQCYSQKWGRSK